MKKILSLTLVVALGISLLAGCSNSKPESEDQVGKDVQASEAEQPKEEPATDAKEPEKEGDAAWPSDTVTFYVPASAGGGTDVSARALATAVSENTGSNVIVSNLTSGNGTVAYETVRGGKADGTELLYFHANFFLNYYNGIYDQAPLENFTPIAAAFVLTPQVIVVNADSEYETLDDFVKAAGEKTLTAGCQNGGFDDLILKLLASDAGIELKMVEAGSETDRITALLGKNLDVAVISASVAAQYIETGDMRALASASQERDSNYSEIPTCVELGYEGTVFDTMLFIFGPKDMDPELVEAMNAEIRAAADNDFVQEYLESTGTKLAMYDVEETNAYMKELDAAIQAATQQ